MSISADELPPTASAELSEADRAAWLRIERALRGMRWWMLFLGLVAGALGGLAGIGLGIGLIIEGNEDDPNRPFLWIAMPMFVLIGISLLPVAAMLVWSWLRGRAVIKSRRIDAMQRLSRVQVGTWLAMTCCAFTVVIFSTFVFALMIYGRLMVDS